MMLWFDVISFLLSLSLSAHSKSTVFFTWKLRKPIDSFNSSLVINDHLRTICMLVHDAKRVIWNSDIHESIQRLPFSGTWSLSIHYTQISTTGALAFGNAFYGPGTGNIYLSNLVCRGNESNLIDCLGLGPGSFCSHREDASVRCRAPGRTCLPLKLYCCMARFTDQAISSNAVKFRLHLPAFILILCLSLFIIMYGFL